MDLLDYLVRGRVRRRLLQLLWAEGRRGSVSELGRAVPAPYAAVHRELGAMRALGAAVDERQDVVRGWLRSCGAPLWAAPPDRMPPPPECIAAGLRLAHDDASVALVLPVLLWVRRQELDVDSLVEAASANNERSALGFFLELAGRLGGDRHLIDVAQQLHDRRRRRTHPFFSRRHGRHEMALTRRNTPALARRWGFLMNVTMDAFAATFAKHTQRVA